jgi:hypothetical protein
MQAGVALLIFDKAHIRPKCEETMSVTSLLIKGKINQEAIAFLTYMHLFQCTH